MSAEINIHHCISKIFGKNQRVTNGLTDFHTNEYLLGVYIVNFLLKIPSSPTPTPKKTPKNPSASNILGNFLDTNGINGMYPAHVYPRNGHLFAQKDRWTEGRENSIPHHKQSLQGITRKVAWLMAPEKQCIYVASYCYLQWQAQQKKLFQHWI